MAFCKFSIDMLASGCVSVDNIFVSNYLPYADGVAVKVYLYGLLKCQDSSAQDNTLSRFASELHLSEQQVEEAFGFWQQQGLVQILNVIPFEVRYLPISDLVHNTKRYSEKKYANFNAQAQEILRGRMITPNEYREYYDIIERMHMEKEALLLVIGYCVRCKGDNVGYNYITTVAKSWISQGLTGAEQVKAKIEEMDEIGSSVGSLAKTLGLKRALSVEEFELYKKWVVEQGFDEEVILYVASRCKKHAGSAYVFEAIDRNLQRYFAQKLTTIDEICAFEENRSSLSALARKLAKSLGLFYENVEPIVDSYIYPWQNMGFSEQMLEKVADYCFKTNVRTLEGMNKVLGKFQKLGILTEEALEQYFSGVLAVDEKIKAVLESVGLSRNVNQFDRDKYKIWTQVWNLPQDVIEYACTLAVGKDQPMQYLSSVLSSFHDKNIKTVEDAKNSFEIVSPKSGKASFSTARDYSKKELNALFQSIEEVEI